MPLFEYVCLKCRKRFELLRSAAERDDQAVCPHCQEKHKPLRLPSIVFDRGPTGGDCGPGRRYG